MKIISIKNLLALGAFFTNCGMTSAIGLNNNPQMARPKEGIEAGLTIDVKETSAGNLNLTWKSIYKKQQGAASIVCNLPGEGEENSVNCSERNFPTIGDKEEYRDYMPTVRCRMIYPEGVCGVEFCGNGNVPFPVDLNINSIDKNIPIKIVNFEINKLSVNNIDKIYLHDGGWVEDFENKSDRVVEINVNGGTLPGEHQGGDYVVSPGSKTVIPAIKYWKEQVTLLKSQSSKEKEDYIKRSQNDIDGRKYFEKEGEEILKAEFTKNDTFGDTAFEKWLKAAREKWQEKEKGRKLLEFSEEHEPIAADRTMVTEEFLELFTKLYPESGPKDRYDREHETTPFYNSFRDNILKPGLDGKYDAPGSNDSLTPLVSNFVPIKTVIKVMEILGKIHKKVADKYIEFPCIPYTITIKLHEGDVITQTIGEKIFFTMGSQGGLIEAVTPDRVFAQSQEKNDLQKKLDDLKSFNTDEIKKLLETFRDKVDIKLVKPLQSRMKEHEEACMKAQDGVKHYTASLLDFSKNLHDFSLNLIKSIDSTLDDTKKNLEEADRILNNIGRTKTGITKNLENLLIVTVKVYNTWGEFSNNLSKKLSGEDPDVKFSIDDHRELIEKVRTMLDSFKEITNKITALQAQAK